MMEFHEYSVLDSTHLYQFHETKLQKVAINKLCRGLHLSDFQRNQSKSVRGDFVEFPTIVQSVGYVDLTHM